MSELSLAVLVCNAGGRILLYNLAAKELLSRDGPGPGLVGLGRSIFAILDRSLVAHALERIGSAESAAAAPGVELAASTGGGRLLRIAMAPVRGAEGEASGFVLILEDVTETAETSVRRDALLRALTEDSRAAVANIRAAVESMLDYPQMGADERQRFTEIIGHEAQALSDRVESAVGGVSRLPRRPLVALGHARLRPAHRGAEEPGARGRRGCRRGEWWRRALAQGRQLRAGAGDSPPGRATARPRRASRASRSTSDRRDATRGSTSAGRAKGSPRSGCSAWVEEPLGAGGGGPAATVREVVERHGGEVFAQADTGAGTACVRLLVPVAEPAARPHPAGPRRRVEPAGVLRLRPLSRRRGPPGTGRDRSRRAGLHRLRH